MDRDEFKATWKNLSARIAFMAAAHAAETIEPEIEGRHWWCCGNPARARLLTAVEGAEIDGIMRSQAIVMLCEFVIANPGAPAEAAFRFAAGREFHYWGADEWPVVPLHWRVAWEVFPEVLAATEKLLGERALQMAEADASEAAGGVVYAAALSERIEDTILEPLPDPLATREGYVLAVVGAAPKAEPEAEPEPQAEPEPKAEPDGVPGLPPGTLPAADEAGQTTAPAPKKARRRK